MPDTIRVVRAPATTTTVRVQRSGDTIRVVRPAQPAVSVQVSRQGPAGAPGPAGAGTAFDAVAATALSGHRVVAATSGGVAYVSNTDTTKVGQALWLTTSAAAAGQPVTLHTFGRVTEPSWNWTANQPVWLGLNGLLTQTMPTAPTPVLRQVASVIDATTLFFNPQPAFVLA